ncbi:MAG: polysaccharide deacetylase family protein, partial [Patescibacteria group bacterium]
MNGYLALCYHYIRPAANDPFPRILGTREDIFREHIQALQKKFRIISLAEAINFSYGNMNRDEEKPGLLFTFDDGLSDHYRAARILAEYGIKAVFFIPTCLLTDGLPINPIVIHYSLAHYGINEFLRAYRSALENYKINVNDFNVNYRPKTDNYQEKIYEIKRIFKYKLSYADSRRVLLFIYKNLFAKDFPEAMEIMHLTSKQIKEILDLGHNIGSHTHSHPSIASASLSSEDLRKEMFYPKEYLERTFGAMVDAFSYPFGEKQDYAGSEQLL